MTSDLKRCSRCRKTKPREDFNRNRSKPGGRHQYCRECAKGFGRDPVRYAETIRAWVAANPEKRHAHNLLNDAVRTGKIIRPDSCEDCGSDSPLHAHHTDYSQPLDVRWLCASCHRRRHE